MIINVTRRQGFLAYQKGTYPCYPELITIKFC